MYSARRSVRWVTEATPAVSVGAARGDVEITGETGESEETGAAEEAGGDGRVELLSLPALATGLVAAAAGVAAGCADVAG